MESARRDDVRRDGDGGDNSSAGFTLIELIITLVVLAILTVGVAPLVSTTVKRQREQQLREALREMRAAIREFHYDALDAEKICQTGSPVVPPGFTPSLSQHTRVMITDCKVFGVDNPDRYPPDLDTLIKGVNVIPRVGQTRDPNIPATEANQLANKKKIYLRKIPIDPMTGEADWDLRSSYDEADSGSWGGENVFDVRSKSDDESLNGEKYSDW